jgi:hypothetical protein
MFSRRFKLTCVVLTYSTPFRGCAARSTVHFFHQTKRQTVLVPIGSGVDVAFQFLLSCVSDWSVIGVVAIDPPHHDLVPFVPSSIPLLVVLSKSEAHLSIEDRQLYRTNANVIVVCSNKEVRRIEWQDLEKAIEIAQENESSLLLYDTFWMWLARTIAKFAEAVARLDHEDATAKDDGPSEDEHQFRNDVISRL